MGTTSPLPFPSPPLCPGGGVNKFTGSRLWRGGCTELRHRAVTPSPRGSWWCPPAAPMAPAAETTEKGSWGPGRLQTFPSEFGAFENFSYYGSSNTLGLNIITVYTTTIAAIAINTIVTINTATTNNAISTRNCCLHCQHVHLPSITVLNRTTSASPNTRQPHRSSSEGNTRLRFCTLWFE